jgi:hypothetical protein
MTVQWLTYAALLKRKMVMAIVVESFQNLRRAMDTDAARDRASMVSAVGKMKITPGGGVSELEITRSW